MEHLFDARQIGAETVRHAYAVALLASPRLMLADFRKEVAKTRNGVLMGVFDRRGYIHALFRRRIDRTAADGGTLLIENLILSDAIASRLLDGMVDALERHARAMGCDQMTVQMAPGPRGDGYSLVNTLENHGFSGKSVVMSRRF